MSELGNTRLIVGDYIADILVAKNGPEPSYYYILQRTGSAEVIDLAYFPTFELAKQRAREALYELANVDVQAKGESAAS